MLFVIFYGNLFFISLEGNKTALCRIISKWSWKDWVTFPNYHKNV